MSTWREPGRAAWAKPSASENRVRRMLSMLRTMYDTTGSGV